VSVERVRHAKDQVQDERTVTADAAQERIDVAAESRTADGRRGGDDR
jgi:hypothetical protein